MLADDSVSAAHVFLTFEGDDKLMTFIFGGIIACEVLHDLVAMCFLNNFAKSQQIPK